MEVEVRARKPPKLRENGMASPVAHRDQEKDVDLVIRHLHRIVLHGPWDLEIAAAMARYGYDAVKWAEGESVLAALVSREGPRDYHLISARQWYDEASAAARSALVTAPQLLAKLGITEVMVD
jgi:hypothetical protein